MKEILQQLGFSQNEAKVYLALLELGETPAGNLIKKTGLHRNIVYTELNRLVGRNLAVKVRKKRKLYFAPLDPKKILQDLKAKEMLLAKQLPLLVELYKKRPSEITVYEGVRAWQDFWLDSVRNYSRSSVNYIAGTVGRRWYQLWENRKLYEEFIKTRRKRKIYWKMIVYKAPEEPEIESLRQDPNLTEIRVLNHNFDQTGNFQIWDQALILQSVENPPLIIEIKNKVLRDIFKQYFNFLWDISKPLDKKYR